MVCEFLTCIAENQSFGRLLHLPSNQSLIVVVQFLELEFGHFTSSGVLRVLPRKRPRKHTAGKHNYNKDDDDDDHHHHHHHNTSSNSSSNSSSSCCCKGNSNGNNRPPDTPGSYLVRSCPIVSWQQGLCTTRTGNRVSTRCRPAAGHCPDSGKAMLMHYQSSALTDFFGSARHSHFQVPRQVLEPIHSTRKQAMNSSN